MRKRKITPKLLQELEEHSKSNNSIDKFYFNFLSNVSRYSFFYHNAIKVKTLQDLVDIAISQYLISLISCWETFFKDVFIFLMIQDLDYRNNIINLLGVRNEEILTLSQNDVAIYLSKSFNFQNLIDLENAYSPIFKGKLIDDLSDFNFNPVKLGIHSKMQSTFNETKREWRIFIEDALKQRHEYVHNSNSVERFDLNREKFEQSEVVLITFPQLFALWIAQEYQLTNGILHSQRSTNTMLLGNQHPNCVPVILFPEDLIADWEISQ